MQEINNLLLTLGVFKKDPKFKECLTELEAIEKELTATNTKVDTVATDLKRAKASYSDLQNDYISLIKNQGFKGNPSPEVKEEKKCKTLEEIIAEVKKGK